MLQPITHILLDAARMEGNMDEAKEINKAHDSLYRGGSEENLSEVAPYIFRYTDRTPFSSWYLLNGWGAAWGVMLKSGFPLPELHKHFRKFLLVKTQDGQELYFRFYDPRVLRIFLPTCDEKQIREFFGPVDYFLVEDEDPAFALKFRHQNGVLQQERLAMKMPAPGNSPISEPALAQEDEANAYSTPELPPPGLHPETKEDQQKAKASPKETLKTPKGSKWNFFD